MFSVCRSGQPACLLQHMDAPWVNLDVPAASHNISVCMIKGCPPCIPMLALCMILQPTLFKTICPASFRGLTCSLLDLLPVLPRSWRSW